MAQDALARVRLSFHALRHWFAVSPLGRLGAATVANTRSNRCCGCLLPVFLRHVLQVATVSDKLLNVHEADLPLYEAVAPERRK